MTMIFQGFMPSEQCPGCALEGEHCICNLVEDFLTDDSEAMEEIARNKDKGLYE